ncbi:unnamed protein product, partial [Urochloa humidicola]
KVKRRLFNPHLYLIVCSKEVIVLIKESMVEAGLLITEWCGSKSKAHLCPHPDPVEDSLLWGPAKQEWKGRNKG